MTPAARRRLALALILVTPALWAANYWVARTAPGVIEPHLLAFLRWTTALGLMLPFAWASLRRHWPTWLVREWPDLLMLGALGMWICGAFVYIGGQTTSATNIGILYATSPVLITVVSARWLGERLGAAQWGGLVLALAGMVLILAKGHPENLLAVRFTPGDWWIVAAVVSWTAYSLLLRARPSVLDPFARLAAIVAGGLLVLLPFTAAEAIWIAAPVWSWQAFWLVVVAAVMPGLLAYQAYSFMQNELGAARTALVMYLGPLYAAAMAWTLLGEAPHWYHGAGAALILPGLWLATRR